jgi:diguanylate cyclase (GGDEF)-like protein
MPQAQLDRLLVVDDDAKHGERLSRRLTRRGYHVDVAGDGAGALEKIRLAEYDLVLLDVTMLDSTLRGPGVPAASASLDLLRLLRATHSPADLPVIMLTDEGRNDTVVEALQVGANDYVVKPVDLPVMTARIEEQLSRSKIGRQRKSARRSRPHAQRHDEGRWTWDLKTNTIRFSARSRAFLGLGPEEIANHPEYWLARIHPSDVERVRAEIRALVDGQTPEYRSEYRVHNHQGHYEWLLAQGWMERSEDGAPTRVRGTLAALAKPDVDALTGLGTRVLILERLAIAQRTCASLALMLVDLDGFSRINESFGQSTGDRILAEVSERLQWALAGRESARSVARIGGDEFAILAEGVEREDASALVDSILQTAVRPMTIDGLNISVAASIGVFCGCPEGSAPEDLLRDAYLAMHRAKELGKNRWHLFEPELRTRARARIATVHDLRYAIERQQLRAYYQPKLNLRTRQITGFEALIRWHHPARGIVYPGEFIELAEDTGLIVAIGARRAGS